MNKMIPIFATIQFFLIVLGCKSQTQDSIKVLPTDGIILNADTIKLGASIRETCLILRIEDLTNPDTVEKMHADFIDGTTGESGTETFWYQEIKHNGLKFYFESSKANSNLKLASIILKNDIEKDVYVNSVIVLGREYRELNNLFTESGKYTQNVEGKITTIFQEGISYRFIKTKSGYFKLFFISVYKR